MFEARRERDMRARRNADVGFFLVTIFVVIMVLGYLLVR